MHDAARKAVAGCPEDLDEPRVGVPFVQKQRQVQLDGKPELTLEPGVLHRPGREVPVVVEPALADRHHLGTPGEIRKRR